MESDETGEGAVRGIREKRCRKAGYWDAPPDPEPSCAMAAVLEGVYILFFKLECG